MSERDRDEQRPDWGLVAGIAAIVLATTVVLASLAVLKLNYNQDRQRQAQTEETSGNGVCLKLPPLLNLCPAEQEQAAGRTDYDRKDLQAQQEMADWAAVVALTSLLGLGLSGVGVLLIYKTWSKTGEQVDAAKTANQTASEALEADQRPWLALDEFTITRINMGGGKLMVFSKVKATNLGKSPASNVTFHAYTYVTGEGRAATEPTLTEYCEQCVSDRRRNIIIFPSKHHIVAGRSIVDIAGKMTLIVPTATPGAVTGVMAFRMLVCVSYGGGKYTGFEVPFQIPERLLRSSASRIDVAEIGISAYQNIAAMK